MDPELQDGLLLLIVQSQPQPLSEFQSPLTNKFH